MNEEQLRLASAIAALDSQRGLLGDAVVEMAQAPLRARLAELSAPAPAAAPAPTAAAPRQQRRQVSVLFTDIVGSTSLSQHLDPEEIHAVMDGALAIFTQRVQDHGGRVLQYAGDSVLAVFGADIAREDDAERAVRAALAIVAAGAEQGEKVRRRYGHAGFNVRVGVHTGTVLLGGGVDEDHSIRGMTVNVAARLEQTAPPGTVRISQDTWRMVRARFDAERQPPLQVKGRDEPLVSYLVGAERGDWIGDDGRGVEGVDTPLVGRGSELAALHEALRRAQAAGGAQWLLIEGEAGLGKSRLVRAFLEAVDSASPPLRSRALPASPDRPYGLLRDLLFERLGLAADLPAAQAGAAFETAFVAGLDPALDPALRQSRAHALGHLLGLDFVASPHLAPLREAGAALREQAHHAATEWLAARARQAAPAPLLWVVDDLHWADEGSLAFIRHLLERSVAGASLLLLASTRPSLRERAAAWMAATPPPGLHLRLQPLGEADRLALADALLSRLDGDGAATLRRLLVDRAQGNPYYMEELVQMLVDDGTIVVDPTHWRLDPARLQLDHLPTTLTGVLQARLDTLPPAERTGLQEASVIGQVFWDEALAAIDRSALPQLDPLQQRGLVRDDEGAPIADARAFAFHHQLLHQVTYDTVLRRVRREWHLRVARWMAGLPGTQRDELLPAIAAHFEQGEDGAEAARHYVLAAERESERFAHAAVITHTGRALALAADQDSGDASDTTDTTDAGAASDTRDLEGLALRWRALLVRQRSLRLTGRMAEQAADLDALEALAQARADAAGRATVALRRATALLFTGDGAGASAACTRARDLAQAAGQEETELTVLCAQVGALRLLGRFDAALAAADEGLALARRLALRQQESELLTSTAAIAIDRGDPARALDLLRLSLAIDAEIGSRHTECGARVNLGDALYRLGDYPSARIELERALALARAIGARGIESVALLNLAGVACFLGDAAGGLMRAAEAEQMAAQAGNREYQAFALMAMGHAAQALAGALADGESGLRTARLEAARAAYLRSAELLDEMGLGHLAIEARAGLLRVDLGHPDADPAALRAGADALLAHIDAHGSDFEGTEHPLWVRLSLWQALARLGDARADPVLRQATAALDTQAGLIGDLAARHRFISAVPHHRALAEAAAARQPPPPT